MEGLFVLIKERLVSMNGMVIANNCQASEAVAQPISLQFSGKME
jgi:hypothetical protein